MRLCSISRQSVRSTVALVFILLPRCHDLESGGSSEHRCSESGLLRWLPSQIIGTLIAGYNRTTIRKEGLIMDTRPTTSRPRGKRDQRVQQPTAPAEAPATEGVPALRVAVYPARSREDLHEQIQKRAYELHALRGYREGAALDDWLEAEREILSQLPPM